MISDVPISLTNELLCSGTIASLFISENGVPTQKGISNALRRGKMHCGSCGSSIEESMIVPLFHLIGIRQQDISVFGSMIKQYP